MKYHFGRKGHLVAEVGARNKTENRLKRWSLIAAVVAPFLALATLLFGYLYGAPSSRPRSWLDADQPTGNAHQTPVATTQATAAPSVAVVTPRPVAGLWKSATSGLQYRFQPRFNDKFDVFQLQQGNWQLIGTGVQEGDKIVIHANFPVEDQVKRGRLDLTISSSSDGDELKGTLTGQNPLEHDLVRFVRL